MRIATARCWLLGTGLLLGLGVFALPARAQVTVASDVIPGPFGVTGNIHLTAPPPGEIQMLAQGGFKYLRTDLKWASIETTAGTYNWNQYDQLVANLAAQSVKPYFILDYGNGLYDQNKVHAPATATARTAFKNWALAAVFRYQNKGIVWELWNEPDLNKFWKPVQNAGDYALLMQETAAAIKAAYPNEILVGPALAKFNSGGDYNLAYLETQFEAGALNWFDAVSVHPYRNNAPENVADDYRRLRRSIKVYAPNNKKIPIVSGEWGYNTSTDLTRYGIPDAEQGRFLSRQLLTNLSNDIPLSIWYSWRDSNTDPNDSEQNYGTVEYTPTGSTPPFTPKPSYDAIKTLTTELSGYKFNKRIWVGSPSDYVLLFTNGSNVKLAVWTTNTNHNVVIPAGDTDFSVKSNTGATLANLDGTNSGLTVGLTGDVQYLTPIGSNDVLRIVSGWKRLPLDSMLVAPLQYSGTMVFENPLNASVTLTTTGGTAYVVPAFGTQNIPISQAVTTGTSGGSGWVNITLRITYGLASSLQMTQQTYGQIPFETTALPLAGNVLPIRVDYFGDDAWSGKVKLYSTSGITHPTNETNISFAAGEHRKYALFTLTGTPASTYTFGYKLENLSGTIMVAPSAKTFKVTDNFSSYAIAAVPTSAYTLTPGGAVGTAANVWSDLHIVAPPAGLPASISKVMRLRYKFYADGEAYIRVKANSTATQTIPDQPKALGMWVYGDGRGMRLQMRFKDASGEEFRVNMANQPQRINWTGWRYVTFPLDGTNFEQWNGNNDGVVDYPITLNSLFMVDNMDQLKTHVDLAIDADEGPAREIYVSGPTYLY